MAKPDLGATADRLFMRFMAPLVLGGEMEPGRPIGGKAALALGSRAAVVDVDRFAHVQLARVRAARRLAPIDRLGPPTAHEWALAAALHDLVQSTHPGLAGVFRASAPGKLLAMIGLTLDRVPPPSTPGEALSRHTWFSRLFEIARTDTVVSWWVGSRTFLGAAPPPRLMAWPELRRVRVDRSAKPLTDLPLAGAALDRAQFGRVLDQLLSRTPLTDLASLHRSDPPFAWTVESLTLVATRAGRTLASRAVRAAPEEAVSAALGRATRQLLVARAIGHARVALEWIGELVLAMAQEAVASEDKSTSPLLKRSTDEAAFAHTVGALVARREVALRGEAFDESTRRAILGLLAPLAESPTGRDLACLLA